MLDAVQNMSRLDLSLWQSLVSRGEHEIDVLPAPANPFAEKDRPGVEVLRALFSFLRLHYDWIVIDAGRWSPAFASALLNDLDKLFIVTSPEIMALYRVKQIIGMLPENGGASEQIGLVLNRVPKRPEVGLKEIETVLGMPVYAVLPEDTNGISDALTRGKLASFSGCLGKAIEAFARRVAGAEEPVLKDRKLSFLRFLPVRG
jgi:Flp pilus assembly CpaE family ATPase